MSTRKPPSLYAPSRLSSRAWQWFKRLAQKMGFMVQDTTQLAIRGEKALRRFSIRTANGFNRQGSVAMFWVIQRVAAF